MIDWKQWGAEIIFAIIFFIIWGIGLTVGLLKACPNESIHTHKICVTDAEYEHMKTIDNGKRDALEAQRRKRILSEYFK